MNLKRTKLPLLAKIIVAIVLGVVFGNVFNETLVRTFLTLQRYLQPVSGFYDTADHRRTGDASHCRHWQWGGQAARRHGGPCLWRHHHCGLACLRHRVGALPRLIADTAPVAVDKAVELKPFLR